MTIDELVSDWRGLIATRKELDEAIASVKEQENLCETRIRQYLDRLNVKGLKLSCGTVTKSTRTTVRVRDAERVCETMFAQMKEAAANGEPLVNHLLLNKAAAQNKMLEYAREVLQANGLPENTNELNSILGPMGFDTDIRDTLHFAKQRSGGSDD
jgi:spore germination protein YaaH